MYEIDLTRNESLNACRQMQTVWDSNLRAISMVGLISKKLLSSVDVLVERYVLLIFFFYK